MWKEKIIMHKHLFCKMRNLLRLVVEVSCHAKEHIRVTYTSKTKKNRLNRKSVIIKIVLQILLVSASFSIYVSIPGKKLVKGNTKTSNILHWTKFAILNFVTWSDKFLVVGRKWQAQNFEIYDSFRFTRNFVGSKPFG